MNIIIINYHYHYHRAEPVVENDDELDIGLDEAELTELVISSYYNAKKNYG